MRPLHILVVEDNFYARLGTVTLLNAQPDMRVVEAADSGSAGLAAFRRLQAGASGSRDVDVVVTDLRLRDLDGASLASGILRLDQDARVVILSQHDGEEDIYRTLRAGARGYVTKDLGGQALIAAIRAVARGERHLPEPVARRLAARLSQPELTLQEARVLALVCKGRSNREIAAELSIAIKTAAVYVSYVLKKLNVRNRTEAAAVARDRGLVRDDDTR
jgi:two-component system NarL family response regulator